MRVKICGIRNLQEARLALFAGADALGFLCGLNYHTFDELDVAAAGAIVREMPPFMATVLVTHKDDPHWVAEACRETGCDTVQLHGELPLEKIPELREKLRGVRIIKAVNVVDESAIEHALAAAQHADAVLLDSRAGERLGGTGRTHDWTISARIVKAARKPVILAGGLNPDNVRSAIETVRPFAVDVNSGVEAQDGVKSPLKVADFVRLAKATRWVPA